MYDRTHRMLTYIIGPSLLNQVLEKKRSLLHHDSTQLLAALDFISNTEFFLTMDDEDQRKLLAKMAVRAWTDFDVEYAWTILPANVEDYLMNKLRRGSKAQQSLLETANSLEDAGYGASMLRGNAGSFKAQHSLLETLHARSSGHTSQRQ